MNYSVSGMKIIFYYSVFGMALLTGLLAGTVAGVSLLTAGLIGKISMLGTFPEKKFPKRQLPQGIFPNGNFPNVQFLRAATSQVCLPLRVSPLPILASAFGPFVACSASVPVLSIIMFEQWSWSSRTLGDDSLIARCHT